MAAASPCANTPATAPAIPCDVNAPTPNRHAPLLAIDAYATNRRRSRCAIAQRPPYATESTPSAAIDAPAQRAPSGIAPSPTRISTYGPSATTTPPSTMATPAGASSSASGSQPWSGTSGVAMATPAKRSTHVASTKGTPRMGPLDANDVRASSGMDKVWSTGVPSTRKVRPEQRDSATNAASIAAEPRAPYTASLAAACSPRAPPQPPMSMTSATRTSCHAAKTTTRSSPTRAATTLDTRSAWAAWYASVAGRAGAGRDERHQAEQGGEYDQRDAHPIDADVPLRADGTHPHRALDQLEPVVAVGASDVRDEAPPDPQRERELDHAAPIAERRTRRPPLRPTRAAMAATSTTRSGSATSSESTCVPSQPSPVGSCARKPMATSPACSSVDVTTT